MTQKLEYLPKRGRLEMLIDVLDNTRPIFVYHSTLTEICRRTHTHYSTTANLLKFLINREMVEIVPRPQKTIKYHRKTSNVRSFIITLAGQQALKNVEQSGLME